MSLTPRDSSSQPTSYQYDVLGNLAQVTQGTWNWKQTFGYDRYGNRWFDAPNTAPPDVLGPLRGAADFSSANNRIVKPGYTYDAAGNLTADPQHTYQYDAENRVVTIDNGTTAAYQYDGDGRRVKKTAGATTTRMIYDEKGQLIAEYGSAGVLQKEYIHRGNELLATVDPVNGVRYATRDHLGSPRVWTNSAGNVVTGGRHDYLPFGEELMGGIAGRTALQNYPVASSG